MMKNRIRSYELTLVTLLAGITLASYLWEAFNISNDAIYENYQKIFTAKGLSFHYFTNVLSPRIGSIIFFLFIVFKPASAQYSSIAHYPEQKQFTVFLARGIYNYSNIFTGT